MSKDANQTATLEKKKKGFKMPHLLWIMIGLLLLCSVLTYIIPAGQFGTDASGNIIGDQFNFLGAQTPVNPIEALLQIFPGMMGAAAVIFAVMISGAAIQVFLDTGTFDRVLNVATYKLQGKGQTLLISVMFILMVYLGGFGGSDALIAIVPIGIVFAKKLKLDPLTALGISLFATMIGFGTGPTKTFVVQGLMGTPMFGAFLTRFIIMNVFMVAGLIMLLLYVKKITKDPTKSPMYSEGWRPGADATDEALAAAKLDWRVIVNMILFVIQWVVITVYGIVGDSASIFAVMVTVMFVFSIIEGIIGGMKADEIGNSFAKGLASMAFVCFVIGMAKSVSLVLTNGNVLHTIVYAITLPLMALPRWISTVGMTLVVAVINPIIPSATSKAAILVPIFKPMGEVLGLHPEMVVQAYQFGDGFTNLVSPLLAWTMGGVAMAKVPFGKWVKWAFPKVLILIALSCVIITLLTVSGWTGAF